MLMETIFWQLQYTPVGIFLVVSLAIEMECFLWHPFSRQTLY